MVNFDLSLYLVTDRSFLKGRKMESIVEEAVDGGVTMVQLREKELSSREFYTQAKSLISLLKPLNIPLIINDRLDIALAVDADGLHIGQSDLPYEIARKFLGKEKIIGLSVETLEDASKANLLEVDYIGISPVFSTNTKLDIKTPFGLEGIKDIAKFTKHKTVAIGGINASNAANVISSGADGIAVVSAIIGSGNPQKAANELRKTVEQSKIK